MRARRYGVDGGPMISGAHVVIYSTDAEKDRIQSAAAHTK